MNCEQRGLIDKLVKEHDVVFDAEFAHPRDQALAIGLALVSNQVGMRRAEHHIDRIRTPFQNRRHGVDHDFDALVGRQQAEGQNDRSAGKSEPGLGCVRSPTNATSGMPWGMTSILSSGTR